MKLSHDMLVTKLAQSLDIDVRDAEEALHTWVETVKKEVSENVSYHVSGLGTFSKKGTDIEFTPDEKLAIEANYKYAGMSPIEVSPSFVRKIQKKDKEGDPGKEEDLFGIGGTEDAGADSGDDIADSGNQGHRKQEEPPVDDEPEDIEEIDKREPVEESGESQYPFDHDDKSEDEDHDEGLFEVPDDEKADQDITHDPEEEPSLTEFKEEDEKETEEEDFSDEKVPKITASSGKKSKSMDRAAKTNDGKSRNYSIWFIPAAAVIITAILLYFHFDGKLLDRQFRDEQEQQRQQEDIAGLQEEPAEHQVAPLPDASDDAQDEEPSDPVERDPGTGFAEDVADVPEESPGEEAGFEDEVPFGLTGPEEEVLIGAYTIVVHSLHNEKKAQIEFEKLEDQDFKATLWQATLPDGRQRWRVGIGQFETVSGAQEAVSDLPEPYRSNNFIIRIR